MNLDYYILDYRTLYFLKKQGDPPHCRQCGSELKVGDRVDLDFPQSDKFNSCYDCLIKDEKNILNRQKKATDDDILHVIEKYADEGLTVSKLQKLLGYRSPGPVYRRLQKLEQKGLICRKGIKKTVIELSEQ
ncbi:MAG: winged helix-turn-helix domain-containing protein [Thermosipho sp. (in: Bacteria)]|nr:winged helix-turn-helix domain-containing protein [Thermosipho sp. (in: thermotogales)]